MASRLAPAPVGAELLDDPAADPAMVAESLRNIARANRWFGGRAAMRWALRRVLRDVPPDTKISLLDIGTGLGDLPLDARQWARGRGIELVPLGLELSPVAARLATRAGVATAVGCAGDPPVRAKCADVVLVSQVAHHFAPAAAVSIFRACDRIARRAVIVCDLYRSRVALAAFRVGATALRFDAVTRADGATSIRRGYRPHELRELLRIAGVHAAVHRRPGYRVVAVWEPGASAC